MKALYFGLIVVCLCGCKSVEISGESASKTAEARSNLEKLNATGKLAVLHSAWCAENWGGPENIESMPDGGYRLRYRKADSLNYLWVKASPVPQKTPDSPPPWEEFLEGSEDKVKVLHHAQKWRIARILGREIKWYQVDAGSGADFPQYETLYFEATAPDGRVGWYQVIVCAESDSSAAEWINRVEWLAPKP